MSTHNFGSPCPFPAVCQVFSFRVYMAHSIIWDYGRRYKFVSYVLTVFAVYRLLYCPSSWSTSAGGPPALPPRPPPLSYSVAVGLFTAAAICHRHPPRGQASIRAPCRLCQPSRSVLTQPASLGRDVQVKRPIRLLPLDTERHKNSEIAECFGLLLEGTRVFGASTVPRKTGG